LRTDVGALLENWVFAEICKSLPLQSALRFWRSKAGAEVAFVIEHAGDLYALEVKHAALKQPKLTRSAVSFLQAYRPKALCVVNRSLEERTQIEGIEAVFMTPFGLPKWLAGVFRQG
jgi:predicted AAA+ superfamily ATPase